MLHITSRDNALYKQLRRLAQGRTGRQLSPTDDKAHSDTSGDGLNPVAILEGVHLCQDWLHHRGQPERAILDRQRLEHSAELQALLAGVDKHRVVTMDSSLLGAISSIARGQGVVFLVHHDVPVLPDPISHACLWLDRIQDPGNVGTLLRTAAAAGIKYAYLSQGCASAWSPRVLRSAQGAHFVMTLYEQVDLIQARQQLAIPLFTTALGPDAVSLYDVPMPASCAWVFGNEGQGVDNTLLASADQRVYIPQDASVESLNVGVAAGICLFEQRRQQSGNIA